MYRRSKIEVGNVSRKILIFFVIPKQREEQEEQEAEEQEEQEQEEQEEEERKKERKKERKEGRKKERKKEEEKKPSSCKTLSTQQDFNRLQRSQSTSNTGGEPLQLQSRGVGLVGSCSYRMVSYYYYYYAGGLVGLVSVLLLCFIGSRVEQGATH